MGVHDLPALNASLNSCAAVLLVWGYTLIRRKRIDAHRRVMIAAFSVSVAFLISYLVYHCAGRFGSIPEDGNDSHGISHDPADTHRTGCGRAFSGGHRAVSGTDGRLRQASPYCEMGASDLAVRERYGRGGLLDAVPDVISGRVPSRVREVHTLPGQSRCFQRYSVQT